jgi:hypothetical protein
MDGHWAGPKVRPRALLLGADWTIAKIRWKHWTRRHADGRGYQYACQGAGGPCHNFWVRIRVWHVRKHHGRRYFAIMKMTHGHGKVTWLVMNTKLGWWDERKRP